MEAGTQLGTRAEGLQRCEVALCVELAGPQAGAHVALGSRAPGGGEGLSIAGMTT